MSSKRPSQRLLDRLASECLEHTKQLGLFDQLRVRLLDSIQASAEFQRLKSDFKRELDTFCAEADLGLARNKLRERLTTRSLPKSAERLRELVQVSSRRQKREMRQLYEQQALQFIQSRVSRPEQTPPEPPAADQADAANQEKVDLTPPSTQAVVEAPGSGDSMATDSGVSCSPPPEAPIAPPSSQPRQQVPPSASEGGGSAANPTDKKQFLRNYHIPKLDKPRRRSPEAVAAAVVAAPPQTPPPSQKSSASPKSTVPWPRRRNQKKRLQKKRKKESAQPTQPPSPIKATTTC